MRQLKAAHLACDRSRKRPLLMPKQFALQQSRRNSRAVELDKGALIARAQAVNGARQQFFARARLALDQHRCVSRRHSLNLLKHLAQACAFANNVLKTVLKVDFFLQILLLLAQPVAQIGNLAEDDGIAHRHGHLVRDLRHHRRRLAR